MATAEEKQTVIDATQTLHSQNVHPVTREAIASHIGRTNIETREIIKELLDEDRVRISPDCSEYLVVE